MQWTHSELHRDFQRAELVSSSWTMGPVKRKARDSNPQADRTATCFQDRLLIRPDAFRLQAAGVGIEPTSRRSKRPILPLDDPASFFRDTFVTKKLGEKDLNPRFLVQSQVAYR